MAIPEADPAQSADQPDQGCRPPLLLVGLALVVLVVAVVIAVQLVRVLYGLVFLPDAPLPPGPGITEIQHENISYGVDEWHYYSGGEKQTQADTGEAMNPCEVIAFYEEAGGTCQVRPGFCEGEHFLDPGFAVQELAVCEGQDEFSIFGLRWEVRIGTEQREGAAYQTRFTLRREALWGGPAPQATSTPTITPPPS